MSSTTNIEHQGTVQSTNHEYVYVKILSQSACASCHAKGLCSISEMKEKVIEVLRTPGSVYKEGDEVTVIMEESLGVTALILGYLIPFVVLMTVLLTSMALTKNELLSGILSTVILIPYYYILSLFKSRLKNKFVFRIK